MIQSLPASVIAAKTGALMKHFDIVSSGRYLIVHKEPTKVLSNSSQDVYAGYTNESQDDNVTLVPCSGIFPCIQIYKKEANEFVISSLQTTIPDGSIRVKVREDARNFIKSGKNELFETDGLTYREVTDETIQNYYGLKFYYFTLKKVL